MALCKGDGGDIALMILCMGGGGGGGTVLVGSDIGVDGGGGGGGGGDGNVFMKACIGIGGGGGAGILEMSVRSVDSDETDVLSAIRGTSTCTNGEGGGGGGGMKDCSDIVDIETDVDLLFKADSGGKGGVGHGVKSLDSLV
jgi:hypothetical protein